MGDQVSGAAAVALVGEGHESAVHDGGELAADIAKVLTRHNCALQICARGGEFVIRVFNHDHPEGLKVEARGRDLNEAWHRCRKHAHATGLIR